MGLHMMKISTFFEKEDWVEHMNPARIKGEKVDNMNFPGKGK